MKMDIPLHKILVIKNNWEFFFQDCDQTLSDFFFVQDMKFLYHFD